jgi:hypothetical protein
MVVMVRGAAGARNGHHAPFPLLARPRTAARRRHVWLPCLRSAAPWSERIAAAPASARSHAPRLKKVAGEPISSTEATAPPTTAPRTPTASVRRCACPPSAGRESATHAAYAPSRRHLDPSASLDGSGSGERGGSGREWVLRPIPPQRQDGDTAQRASLLLELAGTSPLAMATPGLERCPQSPGRPFPAVDRGPRGLSAGVGLATSAPVRRCPRPRPGRPTRRHSARTTLRSRRTDPPQSAAPRRRGGRGCRSLVLPRSPATC